MTSTSDDPRLHAMGLFFEVHKGLAGVLCEVFARHGLSGIDFDVLIRLSRAPGNGLRMTDIATQSHLSTSGATRVIDRLERNGLVRRETCASDRRGYFTVITEAGRRRLSAVLPELLEGVDRHFTGVLPPDELARFLATLRVLQDALTGVRPLDCSH